MNDKIDLSLNLHDNVREGYSDIAKTGVWLGDQFGEKAAEDDCCSGGSCCGGLTLSVDELAEKIGYDREAVEALPEGTNMGLSCGNPTAIAALKEGDVVIDLGSGGGFDIFLSGPKVGASGRAIGIDMTPDMLSKARRNAQAYRERTGLDNVEVRLGEIEHLPVADNSVDVIISNCVINLSPRKAQVLAEMHRVLKPGGRVAVSDMALYEALPEAVMNMVESWIGCVSGAALISEFEQWARDAGFSDVKVEAKSAYVDTLVASGDPLYEKIQQALPEGKTPQDYITSMDFTAVK